MNANPTSVTTDLRAQGWSGWSLANQFALAGGVVVTLAALVVGSVLANRIEAVVVRNAANTTALFLESTVAPTVRDSLGQESLSARHHRNLDDILRATELGERILSYKIWAEGGRVIDASDQDIEGQVFEVSEALAEAWSGQVSAEFDAADSDEAESEAALGVPLVEIYAPIRSIATGEVVAVVEFYEIGTELADDLARARRLSWALVTGVFAAVGAALFLIVLRGSRTIDRQIAALRDLSARNVALRLQMQEASGRHAAMTERALRQIGADLHDGPAQLMGFAALRLDAVSAKVADAKAQEDLREVQGAVTEAVAEIRNLSRGLSVPQIDRRDMGEVIQGLADTHAARTGTAVRLEGFETGLPDLAAPVRLSVYRFVQEGLNNAWRHAGGRGQVLRLQTSEGSFRLAVLDEGPGIAEDLRTAGEGRLGLAGLSNRIEALGGKLTARRRPPPEEGTILEMTIDPRGLT